MKKILLVLVAAMLSMTLMTGCGIRNNATADVGNPMLIGTWDWELMDAAIVLHEDGRYSWLGVNYGVLGYRWSSNNEGSVSFRMGPVAVPWFVYEFIDDDTIDISYVATPMITYRLHRVQ